MFDYKMALYSEELLEISKELFASGVNVLEPDDGPDTN
jgi:hypothetical protein